MPIPIDRRPPPLEKLAEHLAARMVRDGFRPDAAPAPAAPSWDEERRQRSYRHCHLPAAPKPRRAPPRDSGAYVPEMAARIEDDPNLTDGARRCARKLAEYFYRRNRADRAGDITVTWLMRALGKSRRSVQRYLRQLERGGYIAVDVIHARTRMCTGLFIQLLAPLFPRHHRQKWPGKRMGSDAPRMSQNNRFRYKTLLIPRELWAARCCDGVWRAWQKIRPPLPAFPSTV